ncbi:GGDEF domain-containing protein [Anoxybacteroides tepidamans]|uniref:GGDEF domain-containing protein n=1 Tax=Anoxybacteroides tepidamans TaxID=265948 RepID=UPI000488F0EE|nr:GGDEF domain-containing protein [Anoxybacillus tepidamans]
MLLRAQNIIFTILFIAVIIAVCSWPFIPDSTYIIALALYWLFSSLYSHLRVVEKTKSNVPIDYGINYSLSFALFAGPLGLLLFETLFRLTEHVTKKYLKTAEPDEWLHTTYNIGAFVTSNSLAFYLYHALDPLFDRIPFGFWLLLLLLIVFVSLLSDICLIAVFRAIGDIQTWQEAIDFIKTRSLFDMGKVALTNGLLFIFLQEQRWDMLISLFLLNYFVSHSFFSKSQSIQHKAERDQFEKMAYTDFLTGVHNRAFMDKKIAELNDKKEWMGVIVADIDNFKTINDTYNHAVGDQVIRHFASTLRRFLREEDFLFRSGGEEFTIFLRHRSFEESVQLVETILQAIRNSFVLAEYGNKECLVTYTSSFGLYFFQTGGAISIEKAYVYADQLLLQAKSSGKNKVAAKCG